MRQKVRSFLDQAQEVIVGKEDRLLLSLCCMMAKGHLLIEDIPGVGKTTLVKFLSKACGLNLSRIQFTNDLLPSDILGTNIFNRKNENFSFHKGPIFGQVILADELNRATPKTQSALLQVMEEYRVTVDGQGYEMENPFFVMATQNPRHQIGTNPLPESQIDRFLMKINMGTPDHQSEKIILLGKERRDLLNELNAIFSPNEILEDQIQVQKVHASDAIAEYILKILEKSRTDHNYLDLSPRSGIDLMKASKAYAYLQDRDHINPEDVQKVCPFVIGHRLLHPDNSSVDQEMQAANNILKTIEVY